MHCKTPSTHLCSLSPKYLGCFSPEPENLSQNYGRPVPPVWSHHKYTTALSSITPVGSGKHCCLEQATCKYERSLLSKKMVGAMKSLDPNSPRLKYHFPPQHFGHALVISGAGFQRNNEESALTLAAVRTVIGPPLTINRKGRGLRSLTESQSGDLNKDLY